MASADLIYFRNNEKISGAHSESETRKATIQLLRTIIILTQTLEALPDDVMMTMKLLYYDDGRKNTVKFLNVWTPEKLIQLS